MLEGNFTKGFKDFVAACLVKDPLKRPDAGSMLKHKFLKKVKKNIYLQGKLNLHAEWKSQNGKSKKYEGDDDRQREAPVVDWDFT